MLFPGFESITPPFLCSAGKVDKTGAVVADFVAKSGAITKNYPLYRDEIALRDDFRGSPTSSSSPMPTASRCSPR
jgi:hypothetical protein